MRCGWIQDRLSAWIDGECVPSDAGRISRHLDGCAACGRLAVELREMVRVARTLEGVDAPPVLLPKLLAAIDQRPARRAGLWLARPALLGAGVGALALATVLALWIWRGGPSRAPAVPPAEADRALMVAAQREFELAEEHYRNAIGQLRRVASEDADHWDAARRASFERDLPIIEDIVARFRRAARLAPADPTTQELLYGAYRQQMRLMQDAIVGEQLAELGGGDR